MCLREIAFRGRCGRLLCALAAVALGTAGGRLHAQQMGKVQPMAATAHPSFEVATIKRSDPEDRRDRFDVNGRRIIIENQTVRTMIEVAYRVNTKQIFNLPVWADTVRFDALGTPDKEGEPSLIQLREMMRKLLAERFGLKLHTEQREIDRYVLTLAKGGPKLEASQRPPEELHDIYSSWTRTGRSWKITNASMEDLAEELQGFQDRPVLDETGLKGRFDVSLQWARDDAPAADADNPLPGFFSAIQEQAGLKLEPSKGPMDVLLVDTVKLPSPN